MLPRKLKFPFGFLVSLIKELENRLGMKLKDNFTKVLNENNRTVNLETLTLPEEGEIEKRFYLLS